MFDERIFNFSAGPSMLPVEVLERAAKEMLNYGGSGMSVMEMSHRSKVYAKIFEETKAKFRAIMQIPENYEILFLQGGASTQFSAIPLNLMGLTGKADYAITGNFSNAAYKEAKRYGQVAVACSSEDANHSYIPETLTVREDASYFYYCSNNTIYGTQWKKVPETGNVPRHLQQAGGCEQVRRYLCRRAEESGTCRPDHRHRPQGPAGSRNAPDTDDAGLEDPGGQ